MRTSLEKKARIAMKIDRFMEGRKSITGNDFARIMANVLLMHGFNPTDDQIALEVAFFYEVEVNYLFY